MVPMIRTEKWNQNGIPAVVWAESSDSPIVEEWTWTWNWKEKNEHHLSKIDP